MKHPTAGLLLALALALALGGLAPAAAQPMAAASAAASASESAPSLSAASRQAMADAGGAVQAPAADSANQAPSAASPALLLARSKQDADEFDQFRYWQWARGFNTRAYEWNALSTKIIFLLVIVIVLFGLYLTYLQFSHEQRSQRARQARPAGTGAAAGEMPADAAAPTLSTLKIHTGGIEISSQIIGLLVLGFSLAFFFLYIRYVYPIQPSTEIIQVPVNESPALPAAAASAPGR